MSDPLHNLVIHVDYRGNRIASIGFTSPSPTADVLNIIPEGCTLTFENKGRQYGIAPMTLDEVREACIRKDAALADALASGIWTAGGYPTTADSATEDL